MFEELIARTASALREHSIPYMMIGGQAVLLYGTPRLTKDIDITVGCGPEDLSRLTDAARSAGLKILPEDLEGFVKRTFVLPVADDKSGIRVDFILSFTPYERQAIERARDVPVAGVPVKFATLEDVIIHKVFAGRPRDMEDARAMLVKHPERDDAYIRRWLAEFDKASEGKKFTEAFEELLK